MIREEYLLSKENMFKEPSAQTHWNRVFKQAIRHTRHSSKKDLLSSERPNQSKEQLEYREKNLHELTYGTMQKFIAKSIRIIQNTGIKTSQLDPITSQYLAEKPFNYSGHNYDFMEWYYRCIYPYSFEDPNAVLVAFPYNPNNYTVAPALPVALGGFPDNQTISIEHKLVKYTQVRHLPDEVNPEENYFSWYGGRKKYPQFKQELDFLFICDDQYFYTWEPDRRDQNGKIIYALFPWYLHNTGTVPISLLAGRGSLDEKNTIKYQESFGKPAFEYFDDFYNSYSDNKVSRVRFNYPKEVIASLPCPAEGCSAGYITTKDEEGNLQNVQCKVCNGTGQLKSPGQFGTIVADNKGIDGKDIKNVYTLVHPPTDGLKFSYDLCFDLLEKGKRELGIDVMEKLSESGTAKEFRLEDLQDILNMVGSAHIDCQERHLWHITCLLNPNVNNRVVPKIDRPKTYALKSLSMLREEAEKAPKDDRFFARMTYYHNKYKGQDEIIRIHELALMWAPILLDTESEINYKHQRGLYDDRDLIKSQYAVFAFKDIASRLDILAISESMAFQLADAYVESLGVLDRLESVPIFEESGNPLAL